MKPEIQPCTDKNPPCNPRNCPQEFCAWRDEVWIFSHAQSPDKPGTFGSLKSRKKPK